MDASAFVPVLKSLGSLADDLAGIGDVERSKTLDQLLRIETVDELHGQVMHSIDFGGIKCFHDVVVSELSGSAHSLAKALDGLPIASHFQGQELERDKPLKSQMARQIDFSHGTLPQW
jgi:hypothetical protein